MRLTPPTYPVFLISVALVALAVVDMYSHIPSIHGFIAAHRLGMIIAGYVILAAGVVFSGL